MPLTLKPATGSGQMTLISVAGTTTSDTLTLPAKTGNIITSADTGTVTQAMLSTNVAGNGPAFYAYLSVNMTINNVAATKIILGTERFDTNNNFASSTFTPTVAGYYQITGVITIDAVVNNTGLIAIIYRNGQPWQTSTAMSSAVLYPTATVSALIYLNGAGDNVELYAYQNTGGTRNTVIATFANSDSTNFQGVLVRAA